MQNLINLTFRIHPNERENSQGKNSLGFKQIKQKITLPIAQNWADEHESIDFQALVRIKMSQETTSGVL